jgi:hypothetical protein
MREAMSKDDRKSVSQTIQREVATKRVNEVLNEFGDELVARSKDALQTGSPILNKPIRSIELAAVGDPNLRKFMVALNAFQRQYGILTAGSPQSIAQLPVAVREDVEKILSPNATLGEVIAMVDQVKREGKREAQGFDKSVKDTLSDMSGRFKGGQQNVQQEQQGTPTRTATGPNGQKLGLVNGKWVPISNK